MTSNVLRRVTFGLGLMSALSMIVAFLALTDIHHAESDVSSEWRVVQVAFAIVVAFHVAAFAMLARSRR
jgi:hypothetical protein